MYDTQTLNLNLTATDNGLTSTLDKAHAKFEAMNNIQKSSAKSGNELGSVFKFIAGTAIGLKVVSTVMDAVSRNTKEAIRRFDEMNRFPKVMESIGYSGNEAARIVNYLADGVRGLPTALNEITAVTKQIALRTGQDLQGAADSALALNNALLASGSVGTEAKRGMEMYMHSLAMGKPTLRHWRSLQQTMGMALRDVAKDLGIASGCSLELYAALRDGHITFAQFNTSLVKLDQSVGGFAERAKIASAGIDTSMRNLNLAVVRGIEGTIRAADGALKAAGMPGVTEMIDNSARRVDAAFKAINGAVSRYIGPTVQILKAGEPVFKAVLATLVAYEVIRLPVKVIKSFVDGLNTLAQASEASRKATELRKIAEDASIVASEHSKKALDLRVAAQKASIEAEKASTAAKQAGNKNTALNTAAEKANADAKVLSKKATLEATYAREKEGLATAANKSAKEAETVAEKLNTEAKNTGRAAKAAYTVQTNASIAAKKAETKSSILQSAATKEEVRATKSATLAKAAKSKQTGVTVLVEKQMTKALTANAKAEEARIALDNARIALSAKKTVAVQANIAAQMEYAKVAALSTTVGRTQAAQESINIQLNKASAIAKASKATAASTLAATEAAAVKVTTLDIAARRAQIAATYEGVKANLAIKASAVAYTAQQAYGTAMTVAHTAASKALSVAYIVKAKAAAILTGSMKALGAVMVANPITAVVVALAALAGAFYYANKRAKETAAAMYPARQAVIDTKDASDELKKSLEDSRVEFFKQSQAADQYKKSSADLMTRLEQLLKVENKTAPVRAEMVSIVRRLNDMNKGLNLTIDEQTGLLSESVTLIRQRIKAAQEEANVQRLMERTTQLFEEGITALNNAELAEARLHAMKMEAWNEAVALQEKWGTSAEFYFNNFLYHNRKLIESEEEKIAAFKAMHAESEAEQESYQARLVEIQERAAAEAERIREAEAAARSNAVARGIIDLEMFDDNQQRLIGNMAKEYENLAKSATDALNRISTEQEESVAQMQANLEHNAQAMRDWGSNLTTIGASTSADFIEYLYSMGTEGIAQVAALANATPDELKAYEAAWRDAQDASRTAMKDGYVAMGAEMHENVFDFATKTKQTLADEFSEAGFSEIGMNLGRGTAGGITNSAQLAADAANKAALQSIDGFKAGAEMSSPSRATMRVGEAMVQGLEIGVSKNIGNAQKTFRTATQDMVKDAQKASKDMERGFSVSGTGMSNQLKTTFDVINRNTRSSLTQLTSTTQTEMRSTENVIRTSGTNINTSNQQLTTSYNTLRQNVVNAINQKADAVRKGSNSVIDNVRSMASGMLSSTKGIDTSFHNTGINATQGLANGIRSRESAAIAAATAVGNSVKRAMQVALQVKSPSRVTTKIGEFTGEGLAVGLRNRIREVKRAADEVARAIIPSMSGINDELAYAGAYNFNVDTEYSGLTTTSTRYTIEVPLYLDGREVARASAPYTKEEIETLTGRIERRRGIK